MQYCDGYAALTAGGAAGGRSSPFAKIVHASQYLLDERLFIKVPGEGSVYELLGRFGEVNFAL
jgi:hypothetical protein